MTRLAVTGVGVLSAAGMGKERFYDALARGERARGTPKESVQSFDASSYYPPHAPHAPRLVEVEGFDPTKVLGDKGLRTLDRITKLLVVATRLCLHDAGWKREGQWAHGDATKVGLVCSNAYGSLEAITELDRVALLEDARYINPAKFPNTVSNSAAGYVSIWEDLRALNVSVSNGNNGALDAVGIADIHIASARADALVTGGGEAMCEALLLAFMKLGAMRAGAEWCLGEGAAMLCLEPDHVASARGQSAISHVLGYGTHFALPSDDALLHPSSEAMARAIDAALADAALAAKDVDLVVSGVSGLAPFDAAELTAIARGVGKHAPIFSPKRIVGESLGAGGALGMVAAIHAQRGGALRLMEQGAPPSSPRHVLVTSLGYYGNASAVVLG